MLFTLLLLSAAAVAVRGNPPVANCDAYATSDLDGYECMYEVNSDLTLHWGNMTEHAVSLAGVFSTSGWCAYGLTGAGMVGSEIIMSTTSARSVDAYDIPDYNGPVVDASQEYTNISMSYDSSTGLSVLAGRRLYNNGGSLVIDPYAETDMVWAFASGTAANYQYHGGNRGVFAITLGLYDNSTTAESGSASSAGSSSTTSSSSSSGSSSMTSSSSSSGSTNSSSSGGDGGCSDVSTIDGFDCMMEVSSDFTLHWALGTDAISLAGVFGTANWCGFGFSNSGGMGDADLVIVTFDGSGSRQVDTYHSADGSYTAPSLDSSQTISDAVVTYDDSTSLTTVSFTRALDNGGSFVVSETADNDMIYAFGIGESLSYHGSGNRGPFTVNFGVDTVDCGDDEYEHEGQCISNANSVVEATYTLSGDDATAENFDDAAQTTFVDVLSSELGVEAAAVWIIDIAEIETRRRLLATQLEVTVGISVAAEDADTLSASITANATSFSAALATELSLVVEATTSAIVVDADCISSDLDGYLCMEELSDSFTLHWSPLPDTDSVKLAGVFQNTGWVAFGFSDDFSMAGSDVVAVNDGVAAAYNIPNYNGLVADAGQTISDVTVSVDGEVTTLEYTRPLSNGGVIDLNLEDGANVQYAMSSDGSATIGYHGTNRAIAAVQFTGTAEVPSGSGSGSGLACDASDLAGYECVKEMSSLLTIHWTLSTDSLSIAGVFQRDAWVALGFSSDYFMIGSEVVATDDGVADTYSIPDISGPVVDASQTVSDLTVSVDGSVTTLSYTRALNNGGSIDINTEGDNYIIFAAGTSAGLAKHADGDRQIQLINFVTGATSAAPVNEDKIKHGFLMVVSWGFLIPSGIFAARHMKTYNPTWFKYHRACQAVGLILAIVGVVIALANFAPMDTTHGALGMTVMVIGCLQPLNAFVRPHPGEARRELWELVHKNAGRVASVLAFLVMFMGFKLLRDQEGDSDGKVKAIGALNIVALALYATSMIGFEVRKRFFRTGDDEPRAATKPVDSEQPQVEMPQA